MPLLSTFCFIFPRLHPDASVPDTALPDDRASSAHWHHPLREYPRIPRCPPEHPRVRKDEEHTPNEKLFQIRLQLQKPFKTRTPPATGTHRVYFMCCCCLMLRISRSLPLGSQVIAVPVNSSLSWHTNRLRDNSKDAYNVSYAWKLVGLRTDLKD